MNLHDFGEANAGNEHEQDKRNESEKGRGTEGDEEGDMFLRRWATSSQSRGNILNDG